MEKPIANDAESQGRNTAELQERQLRALAGVYKQVEAQNELMRRILEQQEAQTEWIASIGEQLPEARPVRVENVNMPFSALVGFILKAAFASIPAAIIFYIVAGIAVGIFLSSVLGIGAGLGG